MEIIKINQQNFTDINKANQPFEVTGKKSLYLSTEYGHIRKKYMNNPT